MQNEPIPEQREGGHSDTFYTKEFSGVPEAVEHFQHAKNRLLNVSEWSTLTGVASADFQLTDKNGKEVFRAVEESDHFRIRIPGPGNESGDGYDWVQVEQIKTEDNETENHFFIMVRPATDPTNNNPDVAHFFADDATSTFSLKRYHNKVTASVHGRNEKPNTDPDSLLDKARNTIVSVTAIAGLSKLQWSQLVKGIVEGENAKQ